LGGNKIEREPGPENIDFKNVELKQKRFIFCSGCGTKIDTPFAGKLARRLLKAPHV
jgi:hypothetical protein